jgi:hypothetical protein
MKSNLFENGEKLFYCWIFFGWAYLGVEYIGFGYLPNPYGEALGIFFYILLVPAGLAEILGPFVIASYLFRGLYWPPSGKVDRRANLIRLVFLLISLVVWYVMKHTNPYGDHVHFE